MAKEEQAGAEKGSGDNKKKMLIVGAAVAVAVVLGAVAFMLMGKGGKSEKKEGAEAKTEAKAEGGGHGAPAGGHGAPAKEAAQTTNIFPLEPFIVNIYDGQELRYLKVKVEMEMASPAVKTDLDTRLSAIRDAILVLLSTKTLQDIQDIQGKNQLKDEILAAVNKFIPPGKVAKIYFTDFVVQ